MEIWLKLGEDEAIIYSHLNFANIAEEEGSKLYDLSINDINNIILFKSRLTSENGKWGIDNSKEYLDSYIQEQEAKKAKAEEEAKLKLELNELNVWFGKYDLQVSEFNRDKAINITPDIHIDNKTYNTITELYNDANANSKRISEIRGLLK